MRQHEFENLMVGNYCTIMRGYDKDKLVEVVHIEECPDGENVILVKAIKCTFHNPTGSKCRRYLKIVNSRDLAIFRYKD